MYNPDHKLVNCRRYHCSGKGYTKAGSGVCVVCRAELEKIYYDNHLAEEVGRNPEHEADFPEIVGVKK